MSELIAIMFIQFNTKTDHSYQVETCYTADTEFRPNLIKIIDIKDNEYRYKIWYNYKNEWSGLNLGKISTIQEVYNKNVECM